LLDLVITVGPGAACDAARTGGDGGEGDAVHQAEVLRLFEHAEPVDRRQLGPADMAGVAHPPGHGRIVDDEAVRGVMVEPAPRVGLEQISGRGEADMQGKRKPRRASGVDLPDERRDGGDPRHFTPLLVMRLQNRWRRPTLIGYDSRGFGGTTEVRQTPGWVHITEAMMRNEIEALAPAGYYLAIRVGFAFPL